MSEKITARFIIQIAGKPVENVEKALKIVEEKLKAEKRFKVVESEILEPELDEKSTLYSGLIEVLARFENAQSVLEFIIDYTPNSIEIEDPEKIVFDNASFTGILNDFSSSILRMTHQVRTLNANIHFLDKKVKELEGKKK